ncbi:SurA N-terminal domain-containing protein [Clostridium formicaceticum]|nr:SurA N-terminal domain-containing protein [Clostridium formicaceticum]
MSVYLKLNGFYVKIAIMDSLKILYMKGVFYLLRKLFLIILSGMLLFSFAACTATEDGASDSVDEEVSAIVALVNGKEIQRSDFENVLENMKLSYQQFGLDFDSEENKEMLELMKEEALNNLIQQELLLQSALEKNYAASQDEIDHELEQIKAQFGTDEEFDMALEANHLTLDALIESIANEIMLAQYIQNEIGEPTVSEEEIIAMYEEYSESMEDLPAFEEMQFELEEELKYQKFQTSFGEFIENLKAQSTIEILL